ncbi:MAG TPA: peroxidase-related enzyme [Edaphobacter sp.]|nr:peroxidase-related enzyme [Edaphobacter sp.]
MSYKTSVEPPAQTNLPVIEESEASPEVARLYAEYRSRFERDTIPGILKCFATHPPLLMHMLGIAESLLFAEGALTRQEKELLATFVSAGNACAYCADSHGYFFRMHGGSEAELSALLSCRSDAQVFSARNQALLRFASLVNQGAHEIQPGAIAALREHGWSTLQIAEAIHITALFATFNRVVNAFGLPSQGLLSNSMAALSAAQPGS